MLRVSGSVGAMQPAFGTSIHRWRLAGRSVLRSAAAPTYRGEHRELFAGVAGLTGVAMQPQVVRQVDFATGRPTVVAAAQGGLDPLGGFTTDCFGPTASVPVQGVHVGHGTPGVQADWKGPSYLDFDHVATRKTCGYTAQQLVHYGFDEAQALGWNGQGQTIVIVDAYGSTTALADLNAFSRAMNLPPMDAHRFQTVYPAGLPTAPDAGWALETTLDIEWAHAFNGLRFIDAARTAARPR
jgi:subtilase family serine protease